MKLAVITDIHGNLEALKSVASDIKKQGADLVVSLGDTVGYGPHPLECLALTRSLCSFALKGNHEEAVLATKQAARAAMKDLAYEAILFTKTVLGDSATELLGDLKKVETVPAFDLTCAHATIDPDGAWPYLDTESLILNEFKTLATGICVLGHTHIPLVYGSRHGLYRYLPERLVLESDQKYLVNVGSVGQPRDGDCRASYGIITRERGVTSFELRRVFYDIQKTEDAMRTFRLSPKLYERLYCGD